MDYIDLLPSCPLNLFIPPVTVWVYVCVCVSTCVCADDVTGCVSLCRDLLRLGVTLAGHQRKIISSVQTLTMSSKNHPGVLRF